MIFNVIERMRSDLRNRDCSALLRQVIQRDDEFVDFASLNQDLAAVLFANRAPDLAFEVSVLEARDDCIFDAVNRSIELACLRRGADWQHFHEFTFCSMVLARSRSLGSISVVRSFPLMAIARGSISVVVIVRTTRMPRPFGLA